MSLKSALQDIKETTLSAVSGLLGKLSYLASLRGTLGRYEHWGMENVHGVESSDRALRQAHLEVMGKVLRTPLPSLMEDLRQSSQGRGIAGLDYVEEMRRHFEELLPEGRQNTPASTHLNSILVALSSLERNRGRATRSTS
ncbi:MAG TPA: hypothetical protein VMS18_04240 [Candidatus Binatia bacterium]|nr:hypothetical protein [Candidatus Binatia bacterium]